MFATLDFLPDLVAFAKKTYEILLLGDLSSREGCTFDNNAAAVIVPGCRGPTTLRSIHLDGEVVLDAGLTVGFAVGNERVIAALGRVKSYLDLGAFTPRSRMWRRPPPSTVRMISSRRCARLTSVVATFWLKATGVRSPHFPSPP